MSAGSNSTGAARLVMALALSPALSLAQGLTDPMQPPQFVAPSSGSSSSEPSSGPVLQSTLLSEGRRIAMIDGKPMKVGDIIGDARIIAIDPASVTLRDAKTTRVIEMYQGISITSEKDKAVKATQSRKAAAGGKR